MRTMPPPSALLRPLVVAAWLAVGAAGTAPAAASAPPSSPSMPHAPAPGRPGEPGPGPAAARVQVDKVCPAAREDAKRVVKLQAAARQTEILRALAASVSEARGIAERRWGADYERWVAEAYRRVSPHADPGARAAGASSRPDLLSRALCRAVARRAPAECADLPHGDRLMCELLANIYEVHGGADACPTSGPWASPCRFLKTHDLAAVRGTPLEEHAHQYLEAARSLDALCDRARRQHETAEDGAPTCIATAVFSAVRAGLAACPEARPGDSAGFKAVVAECRAMVAGDASGCDAVSITRETASRPAVKLAVVARVFPTLQGPALSVFLVAPRPAACALKLEVDTRGGGTRRLWVAGTTGSPPAGGDFWAPAAVPADVLPGRDARLVSRTCVPWAF